MLIGRMFVFVLIAFMTVSAKSQSLPPIEKGVSQKLAQWRAANYSDVRYKLNLTIEKKAPTLKGAMEITLNVNKTIKARQFGRINEIDIPALIVLDWRKIKGNENLSKISNVSINGEKLKLDSGDITENPFEPSYKEESEHLIFQDGVKLGENIIKLDFESPILTSGSAITRYIDKEDGSEYIYSLFVPSDASTAFPVFDQPDLKARFSLITETPLSWKAISNSSTKFYSTNSRGDTNYTTEFEETKPISTYVFAFAVGEFSEFQECSHPSVGSGSSERYYRSRPCKNMVYVRKSQAEKFKPHAEEVFRLNRESIKYLEDYFDYKFPFPKYDLVLIPEFPFGGMEHAGATFLRESSIIFPTEPTANNYISRANLIFHENAHQWFGDTVTMKWFDDLWLKEGFATFMAYKAMEKVLPEYNAWKVFYERTKQQAYLTDVTRGTTPIYQEIPNLNSAKSAYGNIVYQKAPGFLKQAEFYLGEKDFQRAVRSFLKKHEFANAEWSDLVDSFEKASGKDLDEWADVWVKQKGVPIFRIKWKNDMGARYAYHIRQSGFPDKLYWKQKFKLLLKSGDTTFVRTFNFDDLSKYNISSDATKGLHDYENDQFNKLIKGYPYPLIFPNYQDYGYGIFLLDEKSKKYILANIQNEKDDFLRSMMWGSLWDSVRFAELDPKDYVELAIKNIGVEEDVSTISSILSRVETAMTYYLSDAQAKEIAPKLENLLIDKIQHAKTSGEKITYFRSFQSTASTDDAREALKFILLEKSPQLKTDVNALQIGILPKSFSNYLPDFKTKDRFDIVTKLIILGDKDAPKLLAELEKTETDDAAKRYAYAAKAGFATAENKAKYWDDFVNNKEISESWIEAAFDVWNAPGHAELTLPYLEKALAELPNHKQNRKIFFVNGWTASFIGGQKSVEALDKVNKFLKDNPKLDIDLQRKILERVDGLERAVKIRKTFSDKK
jgi:aminopeptidase N